ncbi:FAD-binding oxidoreductase [candidate division KSB1 bacterium]|nr:FAD-binding oxidoreductase [candidate division KSB1 bacterium]
MKEAFKNISTHFSLQEDEISRYAVRGIRPMAVAHVENTGELCQWLKECWHQRAKVNVWGAGGFQELGGALTAHDITVTTSGHHKIVDYDHDNFTVTVKSGLLLGELANTVKQHNQFLPYNPATGADKTIGGLVAANEYGSLCFFFGTARDLVLGLKIVLADGRLVRFGGKTMKNVAGYDLCKLFIGSMGTLGVIDEITLKLYPLPQELIRFEYSAGDSDACQGFLKKIYRSNLPIWDVVADSRLFIRFTIPTLGIAGKDLIDKVSSQLGETLQHSSFSMREYSTGCDDFFKSNSDTLVKWIVPKSRVSDVFAYLNGQDGGMPSLAYPGRGVVFTRITGYEKTEQIVNLCKKFRDHARKLDGRLNVYRADIPVVQKLDVWDVDQNTLYWSKALKKEYDPQGVFASGRFVGGI